MFRLGALIAVLLLAGLHVADAQSASNTGNTPAPLTCVKGKVQGGASTYNPNYAGWKTGGQSLATGGTYNPNNYEAALQLDLAKQYGCGYGSGKTCHAVVEDPASGRAMIVLINDNGPLVPGRVIDLNELSMRYLSGGKYGRNSGVIENVVVTVLCAHTDFLGPLNPADREAWKRVTADTPVADLPMPSAVTPGGSGIPYASTLSKYLSPSSIPTSLFSGGSSLSPSAGTGSAHPSQGATGLSPTTPSGAGQNAPLQSPQNAPSQTTFALGRSEGSIIVQPKNLKSGGIVSWTSVNMTPSSCVMQLDGQTIGQGNEGTKRISSEALTQSQIQFKLKCTTAGGQSFDRTETVAVQ